jgi:hypothetical protein
MRENSGDLLSLIAAYKRSYNGRHFALPAAAIDQPEEKQYSCEIRGTFFTIVEIKLMISLSSLQKTFLYLFILE